MCWAVPEVCKRQWGSMHILALRRCAPAVLHIRWRGNVLRLRRAVDRGAGAAWGVVGSDPRGTGARFGRGAVRVFARSSPPPAGVAPQSAIRSGRVPSAASRRRMTRWPTAWSSGCPASPTKTGMPPFRLACSLPAWDRWSVATPRGVGCSMHIPTLPRGTPSVQGGGSLRSRPPFPARHSRPADRGTTAIRTRTCVDEAVHVRTAIPRTSGLLHMCGFIRAPTRPFRVLDQPPASIPSATLKTALEP